MLGLWGLRRGVTVRLDVAVVLASLATAGGAFGVLISGSSLPLLVCGVLAALFLVPGVVVLAVLLTTGDLWR